MSKPSEHVLDLIRKVFTLSETGVAGERDAAKDKLDLLLKKHGVTLDDLVRDTEPRWVEFHVKNRQEADILCQIVLTVLGQGDAKYRRTPNHKHLDFFLTREQGIDVRERHEFYRKAIYAEWKETLRKIRALRKNFATAFVVANEIYVSGSTSSRELTDDERRALEEAVRQSRGMDGRAFQRVKLLR